MQVTINIRNLTHRCFVPCAYSLLFLMTALTKWIQEDFDFCLFC